MVVVEDLISTGGSVLNAVAAASEGGQDSFLSVVPSSPTSGEADKKFAEAGVLETLSNTILNWFIWREEQVTYLWRIRVVAPFQENQETWQNK